MIRRARWAGWLCAGLATLLCSLAPIAPLHAQALRPDSPEWREHQVRRAAYHRMSVDLMRQGARARLREARELAELRERAARGDAKARAALRKRPAVDDEGPRTDLYDPRTAAIESARRTLADRNAAAAVIPTNVRCNNPAGDGASAAQSETAVAALGSFVVVAWNDGHGFDTNPFGEGQGYAWSNDGGVTFTDGGNIPHPAAFAAWLWSSDPVLTVNEKTGEFWYCGLADPTSTTNAIGVARGRFTAGTFAFDSVFVVRSATSATTFLDKQWVSCDSLTGNMYVCNTTFTTTGDQIDFYRSTNGGRTWSTAATLSSAADMGLVQGSRVAVGPAGEVYCVWSALETNVAIDTDHFRIRKSVNGGASFAAEVTAVDEVSNYGSGAPGFNRERGITFPSITVDRTAGPHRGRVYLAWNESFDWLDDPFPAITAGNARKEIEPNGAAAAATPASVGQVLRGALTTTGGVSDIDYFSLPMTAGQSVIVYADSFTASRAFTLRMFAPAPDTIQRLAYGAKNDSTSTTTGVIWVYTAPVSGNYLLRLAAVSRRTMNYRVLTTTGVRGAERGRDARDAFVNFSDNGTTWSTPARVNDDAVGFDNYLPEVTVGADGLPYTACIDFRDDGFGSRMNAYVSRSGDGGATWAANQRVTSVTGNFTTCPTNMAPNMGDYVAIGAGASSVYPVWADARGANVDTWATAVATTSRIASTPNDTTMSVAGAADFGWSLRNDSPLFAGNYTCHWSSTRAWPMPGNTVVNIPAASNVWQAASIAVPDTAASGSNTVCLTLTGPGGLVVGTSCFHITAQAGQLGVDGNANALALARSYPNPNAGHATIGYSLPAAGHARILVYDIAGARVRTLVDSERAAGHWSVVWDGLDERGSRVRAGAYFYTLEFAGQRLTQRLVMMR